jgi:hypothetical protein
MGKQHWFLNQTPQFYTAISHRCAAQYQLDDDFQSTARDSPWLSVTARLTHEVKMGHNTMKSDRLIYLCVFILSRYVHF